MDIRTLCSLTSPTTAATRRQHCHSVICSPFSVDGVYTETVPVIPYRSVTPDGRWCVDPDYGLGNVGVGLMEG